MIAQFLSDLWKSTAPAMGNHLWQSTVFAAVAGLLTLVLRKNHAGARYWLWMAASIKFLLPFSLLVTHRKLHLAETGGSEVDGRFLSGHGYREPAFLTRAAPVATHTSVLANSCRCSRRSLPPSGSADFGRPLHLVDTLAANLICDAFRSSGSGRTRTSSVTQTRSGWWHPQAQSCFCSRAARWSPASLVSPARCWSGRKESQIAWKTRILRPLSLTKSGMFAVTTILPLSSTCWWKPSSGFTRWSGGWAPDWLTSANARVTNRSCS